MRERVPERPAGSAVRPGMRLTGGGPSGNRRYRFVDVDPTMRADPSSEGRGGEPISSGELVCMAQPHDFTAPENKWEGSSEDAERESGSDSGLDPTPESLSPEVEASSDPHSSGGSDLLEIPSFILGSLESARLTIVEHEEPAPTVEDPETEGTKAPGEQPWMDDESRGQDDQVREDPTARGLMGVEDRQVSREPSQAGGGTSPGEAEDLEPGVDEEEVPNEARELAEATGLSEEKGSGGVDESPGRSAESMAEESQGPAAGEGLGLAQLAGPVAAFCRERLGSWGLARDAAAETLITVLRRPDWPPSADPDAQREAILYLAERACLDTLRRSAFLALDRVQYEDRAEWGEEESGDEKSEGSPEQAAETAEARKSALEALEGLEEPRRSLVKMRLWNEVSFEAIAEGLAKTPDSVLSLYRSALKMILRRTANGGVSAPDTAAGRTEDKKGGAPASLQDCLVMEGELKERVGSLRIGDLPPSALAEVARRVLEATGTSAGSITCLHGPVDVLPAFCSAANKKNLRGQPFLTHRAGDRLFGGDLVLTGKGGLALAALDHGYSACVSPGSVVLMGHGDVDEAGSTATTVAAGAALFLPPGDTKRPLQIRFPGGQCQGLSSALQVSTRGPMTTRIEVYEGVAEAWNSEGKHVASKGEAILCRSGQNAMVGPARKEYSTLVWADEAMRLPEFPDSVRSRILRCLDASGSNSKKPAKPSTRAVPTAATTPAGFSVQGFVMARKKALLSIGVGLVVVIGLVMALSGGGETPEFEDWMQVDAKARRAELGLPAAVGALSPTVFRFAAANGAMAQMAFSQIPVLVSPEMSMEPQYLTREAYANARARALSALLMRPAWPETAEAMVAKFCADLTAKAADELALDVPGIPAPVWYRVVGMMGPIVSHSAVPVAGTDLDSGGALFEITLQFGTGSAVCELAVTQDPSGGDRPFVDGLATRWNAGAGGPPGL